MEYVADRIFGTGKNWLSNTLYIGLILLAVIFWLSFFKYTVFHTLVELAAVLVSLLAFTVAWSTFPFTRNSYLMFLGTGYLWVGILDLIHLATLRDLQLLVLPDNNINAQFWLAARFMEVSVLIGAVLFARRNLVPWLMMALFCLACGVLYWLIFTGKFPDAFLDTGLTPFKVYSEYAIILLLVVAAGLTYIRRPSTSELVFLLLLGSILVTILSEFLFTLYSNVDSWPNVTGHLTKFVSFWMIFIAIARATLTEPFRALSREAHTYDVVPESIALIDSDLIIRQVNRKARKIAGAGAGELIGRHCHEVFHAGLATPEECPVCDRIRKGERGEPLVLEDDEGRHFEFNLSPIGAHMGPMGSVQVMRDVTLVVKSRQEIDSFFESALDMHCIVDRQGRFKRINKAFLNLLGVTEGEAIGRPFRSFIHPDDLERSGEAFQALLRGEPIANFENRFLDSDGKEHWLNWQATMDQKVDRVLAMARDVTQQKKLEHEIRSGERLLQTVLDTIPNWLWVKDVSGRYLMVNRAMAEFFRLEPQQVAGRTFAEISFDPPEKIENNSRLDRQVIENNQPLVSSQPSQVVSADGSPRHMVVFRMPLRDDQGRPAGVVGTSMDMTGQMALEEQLRHSQRLEATGQLAGGIAHDFNNTLQLISGYAELLEVTLGLKDSEELRAISTAVQGAANLTRQLLAFGRKQVLQTSVLDVNNEVVNVCRMLGRVIGETVELKVRPGADTPRIEADQGMLEQVLINLCVNSRDAQPQGGEITISTYGREVSQQEAETLGLQREGLYSVIEVSDRGQGMSPEVKDRIFEPYFTTKEKGKGSGLGLAMAYGIMRQHQGCIKVESQPGEGSAFRLFFPGSANKPPAAPASTAISDRAQTQTVLVVEDEPAMLRMFTLILEKRGYRVLPASNGEMALRLFREHRDEVEIAILDVVMPGMSGREVFEQLRREAEDIPVLFCTGYSADELDENVLGQKQVSLIRKPVHPAMFFQAIEDVLRG